VTRNAKAELDKSESRIFLPFITVNTKRETVIDCQMAQDHTEYFFDFSLPFEINDDNEILHRMGLHDVNIETQKAELEAILPPNLTTFFIEQRHREAAAAVAIAPSPTAASSADHNTVVANNNSSNNSSSNSDAVPPIAKPTNGTQLLTNHHTITHESHTLTDQESLILNDLLQPLAVLTSTTSSPSKQAASATTTTTTAATTLLPPPPHILDPL